MKLGLSEAKYISVAVAPKKPKDVGVLISIANPIIEVEMLKINQNRREPTMQ